MWKLKNRPGGGFKPPPMVRPGTAVATPPQQLPQQQTTATSTGPRPSVSRPLPNSKFVCGVKGNHRELRQLSTIERNLDSTYCRHSLHISKHLN